MKLPTKKYQKRIDELDRNPDRQAIELLYSEMDEKLFKAFRDEDAGAVIDNLAEFEMLHSMVCVLVVKSRRVKPAT